MQQLGSFKAVWVPGLVSDEELDWYLGRAGEVLEGMVRAVAERRGVEKDHVGEQVRLLINYQT